ncbi:MAG: hypothetical protein JSS28_11640 [Proteobacteria bacterium]|nr:hypothetical protein [Pseudomonadota bacterium]
MIRDPIITLYRLMRDWVQGTEAHDHSRELLGMLLANQTAALESVADLRQVEFRVHSQFGDDGIIQWLIARLPSLPKRFVEFGVEDYSESNTRFLMVSRNWSGLVMDGSSSNIARLRRRRWFWRYNLTALPCFVTCENVDGLIAEWAGNEPVGLLHIDVDGNDYWLWDAIKCISPGVVIMEYSAVFGDERAITIPYAADFRRFSAHYSGQYAGASLAALTHLAARKGYALIGSNSAGNNTYFLRRDLLGEGLVEVPVARAFVRPNFRSSRNQAKRLDFLSFEQRQSSIRGMPVVNVVTGLTEPL